MKRILSLLIALALLVGAYFALNLLLWQHRAITAFTPTPAYVLSAEIRRHSGKSTTWSPEITYRYTYQDREYRSSQVLPVSVNASHSWASEIVQRYGGEGPDIGIERPSRRTTAYVNPDKPEEAILVREYAFTPYFFTLAASLGALLLLGVAGGIVGSGRNTMMAVPLDESDARLLLPRKSLQSAFRHAVLWFAGAAIVTLPLLAHWTLAARQSPLIFGVVALAMLGTLGAIAFRRWSLTRTMSDARLRVRPAPMARGEVFAIELEADVYMPLRIKAARAKVRCIEHYKEKRGNKTSYGTRTKHEQVALLSGPATPAAGQVLSGKGELFFAAGSTPPTTDLSVKIYPYYTWELQVLVEIEQHADYSAVFPLDVV